MGNERANISQVVVRNDAGDLEIIDLETGEVVSNNRVHTAPYKFSYEKALYICQLVREGKTWKEISLEPDMPPLHVIAHWQRSDRMFAEELKIARSERAEHYHDQAMTIAKVAAGGAHKDDVPALTLAAKLYQWGAERAKPESYGSKVTHEGSTEKPILLRVVNTGISRPAKADVIQAEIIKEVAHVSSKEGNREGSARDSGEDQTGEGTDNQ